MTTQDLILVHAPPKQMAARLVSLCWRPNLECYYFGHAEYGGHSLRDQYGHTGDKLAREAAAALGVADLDTTLCWNAGSRQRDEIEGRALLTQRGGWTALAFWDHSGDTRPGSNTAFLVRGALTFDQMVRVARHRWPKIWARFTFVVVEVDERGRTK